MDLVTLTIRQEVAAAFTQYEAAQSSLQIYAQGVRQVARQNLEVIRKAYDLVLHHTTCSAMLILLPPLRKGGKGGFA
jgi:hypothetical protein